MTVRHHRNGGNARGYSLTIRVMTRSMTAFLLSLAATVSVQAQNDAGIFENIGNRDINGGQDAMSVEDEIALGRELAAELEPQLRLVADPVILAYVDTVGQRLVSNSDARVPFAFKVIDDPTLNALSLPGGLVYVNTGTILAAGNEAGLASVLAHEIARVAARHDVENRSRGTLLEILSIPTRFFRAQVQEADFLGVQYLFRAGYDPDAAATFLETIQAVEPDRSASPPPILAVAPPIEDRIDKIRNTIGRILPERANHVLTTSVFEDVRRRLIAEQSNRLTVGEAEAEEARD